ncbi:hypothetical protein [Erythrobacter sp.]|uniref:hypothetical protein n=1 Tax=Erythrobacter sp. TaxID=1042 RepID=UPI0025E912E0|nr:hypothetical protein [Erythrobacter sp.]
MSSRVIPISWCSAKRMAPAAPALIARIVCAEAILSHRVLLAVEHPSVANADWQDAWALPHDAFRAALPDRGWRGRFDGVGREAMLALVLGAHALKDGGAEVDIVAFNGTCDDAQKVRFADLPSQGPHQAAQAENIAEGARRKNYDRVIVLVGGLHAATAPVSIGGPLFEPMAMRLRSYGSVVSLELQHGGGGEAWTCQRECKANRADVRMTSDRPPYIGLGETPSKLRASYDGIYWVGPITASPPAFPPEN